MLDKTKLEFFASAYASHFETTLSHIRGALSESGIDALVIHSGTGLKKSSFDDQYWPIKATPALTHFLPLQEEDGALLIDKDKVTYFRGMEKSFWEGPSPLEADYFWNHIELVECSPEEIKKHLPSKNLAAIVDENPPPIPWLTKDIKINPPAFIEKLHDIRAIKTPYELACLGEANRRASFGHEAIKDLFLEGCNSELSLLCRYLEATGQDAHQTPYQSIVALGKHAAILHHVQYKASSIEKNESLLVDAGATCLGYGSDITRTYTRGATAQSKEFSALISKLLELQNKVIETMKEGLAYEDLHETSHRLLAGVLIESELAFGSPDALVDQGITRTFFPHGLGHSLGIQTHDVGCKKNKPRPHNPFLRTTVTLKAGHVMTIEPGCYFIAPLLQKLAASKEKALVNWPKIDALRPMGGIRIEDNIALTHDNLVNLTRDNWCKNS